MEDIELVIKIPKAEYNYILKSNDSIFADCASKECMMHSIKNGTPLPKGHGRLIDADELKKNMYHDSKRFENAVAVAQIDWADTIIEADKE